MIKKILPLILLMIPFSIFSQTDSLLKELELNLIKGQYDSTIKIGEELLKTDTANWLIYFYIAKSHQSKYNYFDAIKYLESANVIDTANKAIENALAASYDFIGKDEAAINIYYNQYLRDTIVLEPIVNLANIFRKKREYAPAIHYYQKAVALDPTNFYYYKQLAFCFDKINMPIGAILNYQTAIMLNPNDASMYIQLANIFNSDRAFPDAIKICTQGLEIYPENQQLIKLQSYAYYLNREFDSSVTGFNRLLEMGDSSFFNLKYQGLAYFEKKDFESARSNLSKAIEYNDKDAEAYFYLGSALGRSGNYEDGIRNLNKSQKLLEPSPNELANIFSEIAYILQSQEKYELALEHLKAAYRYSSDPLLSFKMAQLYDVLGNKKLAINYYDGFLILVNPPESSEFKIETDKPVIKDQAMIDHAKERIRILKEEMFFEEAKK